MDKVCQQLRCCSLYKRVFLIEGSCRLVAGLYSPEIESFENVALVIELFDG